MSVIAILLCFIPFALIWWKKLNKEKAYLFVGIYWCITGLINTPQYLPAIYQSSRVDDNITLIDNLVDTPLMLLIFYFSAKGSKKRLLQYLIGGFVIFESIMILWKGNNFDSNTVIIGLGSLLTFCIGFWSLADFFQKIEHSPEENAMGFIYAGFVFYYGIFLIIWVFNYLYFKKETVPENAFIYYLNIILATSVISIGLWRYSKPGLAKAFHK
jgi:uncharacterized membrane protein HdeD (DUF308 family)